MIKIGRFVLSSMVVISILAGMGSVAYAKTGDNRITDNPQTFKEVHIAKYARYDMMPGYTQVTGVNEGYSWRYKWVRYAEAGARAKHYFKICDEKKSGYGKQYLYTPVHRVLDMTVRRYNEGQIYSTNYPDSKMIEKYCRTIYKKC